MIQISGGRLFRGPHIAVFEEDEDSFGNILELAQYFGWEDTHGHAGTGWTPEDADNCEEDALFFLESQGVWVFVKTPEGELRQVLQ